jgi:NAD(P)-dependent dehydrogenase (short-subunit alcohol dehydrogenase family)
VAQLIDFKGKNVVITGCFSGMGNAAARLLIEAGGRVHGLDYKPVDLPLAKYTAVDLRDPQSIQSASAAIDGPVDALFNCAGLPGTFSQLDIFKVNYLGPRMLTDLLIPRMPAGSAICCISSTAGMGWPRRLAALKTFVAMSDPAARLAWVEDQLAQGQEAYVVSKEAIVVWTAQYGHKLIRQGIRMNCILPGPTATPFMEAQSKITPDAAIDIFTQPINRRSQPQEQAAPLVFLGSPAASYINGIAMPVDGGFMSSVAIGEIDLASAFASKPKAS